MSSDHRNRVFIGGISDRVQKEDIEKEFSRFGKLSSVWVAQNPPGFAFVEYEEASEAEMAVVEMNGKPFLHSTNNIRVEHSHGGGRGRRGPGGGGGGGGGGFGGNGGGGRNGMWVKNDGGGRYGDRDRYDHGGGGYGGGGGGGGYRGGPPSNGFSAPRGGGYYDGNRHGDHKGGGRYYGGSNDGYDRSGRSRSPPSFGDSRRMDYAPSGYDHY